ncbi:hypothetical protein [Sphingomonas parapaucimobilis]
MRSQEVSQDRTSRPNELCETSRTLIGGIPFDKVSYEAVGTI